MGRFLIPLALIAAVAYYYWARRDPAAATRLKEQIRPLVLLALGLLYLGSPIDFIPDGSPVGIIDDLLVLLAALYFGRAAPEAEPQPAGGPRTERRRPSPQPAAEFDPFAILGVARGASQEEIAKAFRDKMKQYHPDRVADLGEELQKLAHDKAIEIRRAYEALRKS